MTSRENPVFYPRIDFDFKKIISHEYIVIFLGTGSEYRKWDIEKEVEVAKLILEKTLFYIVIAGGQQEEDDANRIQELESLRVKNLVGQMSLIELTKIIKSAYVVLTNETSVVHIAIAVQTHSVCILGGGHFGRFMPYLEYIIASSWSTVVYNKMSCFKCDWESSNASPLNSKNKCKGLKFRQYEAVSNAV